jgi:hypothetical protein
VPHGRGATARRRVIMMRALRPSGSGCLAAGPCAPQATLRLSEVLLEAAGILGRSRGRPRRHENCWQQQHESMQRPKNSIMHCGTCVGPVRKAGDRTVFLCDSSCGLRRTRRGGQRAGTSTSESFCEKNGGREVEPGRLCVRRAVCDRTKPRCSPLAALCGRPGRRRRPSRRHAGACRPTG